MHDVVIRGGNIVDGTGKPAFRGDVAIAGGRIAEVGTNVGGAEQVVDADGLLVTPAWVDVHTHYDGQVAWDEQMTPSLWHGVSTVVMGNCGVGFAPATPDRHDWLIGLMEGVEDIPGPSLSAGLPWGWQSFSEYLEVLESMPRTLDVGGMITHGALRAFVMGERGAKNEPATEADIARMAALVKEAVRAGALGFSSSRTLVHTANDGEPVPGTFAEEAELLAIAQAVRSTGRGLIEMVPRGIVGETTELLDEIDMMIRVSRRSGCPLTFLLAQNNVYPDQWRDVMGKCTAAVRDGVAITPMVFARPVCVLFSFQGETPFEYLPSYQPLKKLPHDEKMAALRDPQMRQTLIDEKDPNTTGISLLYQNARLWERTYPMGENLNYEPSADKSVAAIARREGRNPREVVYDLLLENNGRSFLMYPAAGYAEGTNDSLHELICDPITVMGGSDAGAHVRQIIDAGVPTYALTHWARDKDKDDPKHLPLELVVKKLTHDGARLFGMQDRGTLEPGAKADVNLIDYDSLSVSYPEMIYDLPAGMPRLMQTAQGYEKTYVSGEVVQENGRDTGARPGGIVRSS